MKSILFKSMCFMWVFALLFHIAVFVHRFHRSSDQTHSANRTNFCGFVCISVFSRSWEIVAGDPGLFLSSRLSPSPLLLDDWHCDATTSALWIQIRHFIHSHQETICGATNSTLQGVFSIRNSSLGGEGFAGSNRSVSLHRGSATAPALPM